MEVFYRDIKQTMAMDILRCKSPAMIDKEVVMHAIAGRASNGFACSTKSWLPIRRFCAPIAANHGR
ncbi:MAG: hypothetical protein ACI9VS_004081 [Candidatus Binatia bacterium]